MNPNYCTIVVSEPDGPFMLPQGQALDSVNLIDHKIIAVVYVDLMHAAMSS